MPDAQPNILFLMADQMSAKALPFYSGVGAKAPNLAALAARGTLFENAYCSFPLCAPSRFAMMAGRLPSRIGAYDNGAEFPSSVPTFVHYLRLLGYETAISGKLHYVGADQLHGFEERLTTDIYPSDLGWTAQWRPDEGSSLVPPKKPGSGVGSCDIVNDSGAYARTSQMDYDEEVLAQALQKIFDYARSLRDRPLLLKASFTQPHDPYITTRDFWDLYDPTEIPTPVVPDMAMEQRDAHSQELCHHYAIDQFPISPEATQIARRAYFGMISDIDNKIGQILRALEETGLAGNTAVVYTSDHGDMMGERGLWFKKTFYEWAMRIPMIIALPKGPAGQRVAEPVSHMDLLPTLVALGGGHHGQLVGEPDGRSLLGAVRGETLDEGIVRAEHLDEGTSAPRFMIRQGRFKFVFSRRYPPLLFDLKNDPEETENMASSPAASQILEDMEHLAGLYWDPERVEEEVLLSQKSRGLVHAALMRGRWTPWDYDPPYGAEGRFVRHQDKFPGVERRGYLPYGEDA